VNGIDNTSAPTLCASRQTSLTSMMDPSALERRQPGACATRVTGQIVAMERAIFTDLPPADLGAAFLERQPGRDVGFVIYVSDDGLGPVTHDVRDAQAERCG
jgi:hypothetical protein